MNIQKVIRTVTKPSSFVNHQNSFGCRELQRFYNINSAEIHKTVQLKCPSAIGDVPHDLAAFQTTTDLNLFMQSSSFNREEKSALNNMLGCRWEQQIISHSKPFKKEGTRMFHTLTNRVHRDFILLNRCESTKSSPPEKESVLSPPEKEPVLSRKDKLKRAVKEYGSTVIVFHVGISLISLGTCYVLVSSGIDMGKLLIPLGVSGAAASNAGTFVTAYAIHKVFAPVRISITLGATPFIVRYLRQIGFLKKPKV